MPDLRVPPGRFEVAHRAGVSIRQLADVSGLGRKSVTTIVTSKLGLVGQAGIEPATEGL